LGCEGLVEGRVENAGEPVVYFSIIVSWLEMRAAHQSSLSRASLKRSRIFS
jgi:hypothetical protein